MYCRNHFGWLNADLALDLQLSESNTEQTLPAMRRLTSNGITRAQLKTDALVVSWVLWIKTTKLFIDVGLRKIDEHWTEADKSFN